MAEFWQLTFPMPGRSEHAARAAEDSGWDELFFADTQCLSGDIYSAIEGDIRTFRSRSEDCGGGSKGKKGYEGQPGNQSHN